MKVIEQSRSDMCMGHLEIAGFEMMKGMKNEHGYSKSIFQNLIVFLVGISITNLMMVRYITWAVHMSFIGTIVEIEKDFISLTPITETGQIINPRTIHKKIYYDDTDKNYDEHDITEYKDNYVKLIVVNKKDLYQFDKFTERLLKADCTK